MARKSFTNEVIVTDSGNAYLPGIKAIVTLSSNSSEIFTKPDADPISITAKGKQLKYIPWGSDNKFPQNILSKVNKSEILSNGLWFNMLCGYGDGILPSYISYMNGKKEIKPYDQLGEEIAQDTSNANKNKRLKIWKDTTEDLNVFMEANDLGYFLCETFIDLSYFHLGFSEVILSKEGKIVLLTSKETSFCRYQQTNDEGIIENIIYSSRWADSNTPAEKYNQIIPIIDPRTSISDLRKKIKNKNDTYRYFLPITLPSPGKNYYPRTPWYSVFESGWYDIMLNIPKLKKAIMENQMTLKYHIQLSKDYFDKIFQDEKITDHDKKRARIKLEYANMNDFLANAENSGKSLVSFKEYFPDYQKEYVTIKAIDNPIKGSEYLEDSEEGGNIMYGALGVHPSLIGASPGKNKTINGTEARELFQIKQSLMKLYRDYALKPLYLVKAINGWDPALQFVIPNMQLTTLDTGKQIEKVVQ